MIIQDDPPTPLTLTDASDTTITIKHVPSSRAIKYLGCHKAPANQSDQFKALRDQCNDFAKVINCSNLNRRETNCFYHHIYSLSVGYPLPLCYFTFDELDRIQKQSHRAMVSHCGYNRCTAKEVLYGPTIFGGAEFFHLYDIQGHGQVTLFIKFWRQPHSSQGKALRITMAWAQYCAGISISILEYTERPLPHLEAKWIASLRRYLVDVKGHLELDDSFMPQLQRQADEFIMDIVITSGKFQPCEIRRINYCRLHLGGVVTVADIATSDGRSIDPAYFNGQVPQQKSCNWHQVVQPNPNDKAWKQWRRALRILCHHNSLNLRTPLGDWTVPASQLRQDWEFWHDPASDTLYRRQDAPGHPSTYTSHHRITVDFDKDPSDTWDALPHAAVPATVVDPLQHCWRFDKSTTSWELPQPMPPPTTILTTIPTLDRWEQLLLQQLDLLVPLESLVQSMATSKSLLACDGAVQENKGSFGWVLSSKEGTRLAQCRGPAFGSNQTSYRAEGYGMLSCLRFLHHLHSTTSDNLKSTGIWCDNESMVDRTNEWPHRDFLTLHPNKTLDSDYDVLAEIWDTLQGLPQNNKPTIRHVKGHQDSNKAYDELGLKAQLNVNADALADSFLADNPTLPYSTAPLLPKSGCQLHLEEGTCNSKYKAELRKARTSGPLIQKLRHKHDWSQDDFNSIDWESHRIALQRKRPHRTTLVKHLHGILPVGKLVHSYNAKHPAHCPSCSAPVEDRHHLLRCTAASRNKWRGDCIKSMRKLLERLNTHPDLTTLLLEALHSVIRGTQPHQMTVPPSVAAVAEAQDSIGWEHLMHGRLAQQWQQRQQQHLGTSATTRNNGKTWAAAVCTELLSQWMELWLLRNQDRHGRDRQSRQEAERRQAIFEATNLHQLQPDTPQTLQWIFAKPLLQTLQQPTYMIRAFVNSYCPIIQKAIKERQSNDTNKIPSTNNS